MLVKLIGKNHFGHVLPSKTGVFKELHGCSGSHRITLLMSLYVELITSAIIHVSKHLTLDQDCVDVRSQVYF